MFAIRGIHIRRDAGPFGTLDATEWAEVHQKVRVVWARLVSRRGSALSIAALLCSREGGGLSATGAVSMGCTCSRRAPMHLAIVAIIDQSEDIDSDSDYDSDYDIDYDSDKDSDYSSDSNLSHYYDVHLLEERLWNIRWGPGRRLGSQ